MQTSPPDRTRRDFLGLVGAGALSTLVHAAEGLAATVPLAPVPLPIQGKLLLMYELQLKNQGAAPATLGSLRIAGDGRRELAQYDAQQLAGRTAPLGAPAGAAALVIAPGEQVVVYIELEIAHKHAPTMLAHDIGFTVDKQARTMYSTVALGSVGSPLGPPLAGGPWVAIHAPQWPRGHRRVVYTVDGKPRIPGRYAIDFVAVDADGRTGPKDSDRVAEVLGYGAPVLAVADAVVASARDDMAEASLLSGNRKHPQADATGNYVSLRLPDGRAVFYEHLKPGSVAVKPGQQVKAGQLIGALGFTGDSTGPHLHFSVASNDSPLGAEGLPFTFAGFELLGHYPDLGAMNKAPWQALEAGMQAGRGGEWPGWNTVVRFPGKRA